MSPLRKRQIARMFVPNGPNQTYEVHVIYASGEREVIPGFGDRMSAIRAFGKISKLGFVPADLKGTEPPSHGYVDQDEEDQAV
jgi:hypothetical protein